MAENQRDTIGQICGRYGNDRTRMMDILNDVQKQFGCISATAIDSIAAAASVARVEVESALSFYAFFSEKPHGRFVIRLCNDIIDRMLGADRVAKAFEAELGIAFGQTTPDGMFTLEWTPCIGMSDQAPAALINDKVFTRLSTDAAREIVRTLKETGDIGKLKFPLGSGNNSHPLVHSMVNRNLRHRGPVIFEEMTPGAALHKALSMSPVEVIKNIKTSRLRGRGGAGFPTGMKWEYTRNAPGDRKYVVCNADEGEPGTFKDRVILTEVPDLMVEGITVAGYAIGASSGVIYLRGEYAYLLAYLEQVLARRREANLLGKNILGKGFDFDVRIQLGAGAYVCGEETALISSCEGLRGDPKNRPPFPAQKGYLGMPTVVNNVETFCAAARIVEKGAGWFSELGTTGSTGTKLFSVSGDCDGPGVYELPFGIKVTELLSTVGAANAVAVQVGGASGQMIGKKDFERTLQYDDLATGGAIMILGPERDPLEVTLAFMDFFCEESCGYCTPCRVGNTLLKIGLEKIIEGRGEPADLPYLEELGKTVKLASRCGLGQTSPNPILTTLQNFRQEYEKRLKPDAGGQSGTFDIQKALKTGEAIAQRTSVHFGNGKGTAAR
jgi:[NiFe] hydrogenase diaphorase moiety large subunit